MTRLAALVFAAVAAAAAGAALAAAPPTATLLARHAPVLVLHAAERFQPSPVEPFLAAAELQRLDGGVWMPHAGGVESASAGMFRLDVRACAVQGALAALDCYAALGGVPTAYGAVHRSGDRIVLQYWLFYPYNLWSPVVPQSPEFWQAHEGDWEQVSVVLDRSGRPLWAAASRHCAGVRWTWAAVPKRGARPVVHVSLGSHANGFRAGTATVDPRCWPRAGVAVYRAYRVPMLDHAAAGRTVVPTVVAVTATRPGWMKFPGAWGEDQYAHFPNATFRFGGGPTGPAQKAVWRNPLAVLRWPPG